MFRSSWSFSWLAGLDVVGVVNIVNVVTFVDVVDVVDVASAEVTMRVFHPRRKNCLLLLPKIF